MVASSPRLRTHIAKETKVSPSPGEPGPFTRRSLLAGAGCALAATALSACAGASGASELTLHQSKPEAVPHFSALPPAYTSTQQRFSVQHDIATPLTASCLPNHPPDRRGLHYNLEPGRFMERGALSDLSDLPEAGRIREDVAELADWYPTYEGRTSVLPYSVTAASVIYNRRIFAEHGLEVPT